MSTKYPKIGHLLATNEQINKRFSKTVAKYEQEVIAKAFEVMKEPSKKCKTPLCNTYTRHESVICAPCRAIDNADRLREAKEKDERHGLN